MDKELLKRNTIFETVTGSNSYGLSTPESDLDVRGIVFSPKEYVYGIERFDQFEGFKGEDKVLFELRFAFGLMANCNPNMLDFLYTDKANWIKTSPYWEEVLENRDLFLSKKARWTYAGYAAAQLRRIASHRNWLFNPIKEIPLRKDFGLPANRLIPKDQIKAFLYIEPKYVDDEYREYAIKERKYQSVKETYTSYLKWKKNRNPKRMALEEKCGYDAKHAMHLIRLVRMGKEILSTGKVNVDRTNIDADYLMAIRKCEVPWANVEKEANGAEVELSALYLTSNLQKEPNRKKINELCIRLYEKYYEGNK